MTDQPAAGDAPENRRHPLGEHFLAAFRPPRTDVTFDDLAGVAQEHGHSLADAMVWLATAQAGDVISEAGSPGRRSYRLTDRGRSILADDPRTRGRRTAVPVG